MSKPIYLDHAATTPVCPAAAKAAVEVMTEGFGNPSSLYPLGRAAAKRREEDRSVIAQALGCAPQELFFTSCGTEGDNWAIASAVDLTRKKGNHIVTTAIEHSAVLEPMKKLKREGFEVTFLKPDAEGSIAPETVKAAIRPDTILVSMMLVNNEVGSILPVRAAADAIKAAGSPALLHTDAVQGFLKLPFSPKDLGADLVTVCAQGGGRPLCKEGTCLQTKAPAAGGRPGKRPAPRHRGHRPDRCLRRRGEGLGAQLCRGHPCAEELRRRHLRRHPRRHPHQPRGRPPYSGHLPARLFRPVGGGGPWRPGCLHLLPPKVQYGAIRISFGPESTKEEVDALAALLRHICEKKTLLF